MHWLCKSTRFLALPFAACTCTEQVHCTLAVQPDLAGAAFSTHNVDKAFWRCPDPTPPFNMVCFNMACGAFRARSTRRWGCPALDSGCLDPLTPLRGWGASPRWVQEDVPVAKATLNHYEYACSFLQLRQVTGIVVENSSLVGIHPTGNPGRQHRRLWQAGAHPRARCRKHVPMGKAMPERSACSLAVLRSCARALA